MMKDFSYLLNRKIKNVEEIKKRLNVDVFYRRTTENWNRARDPDQTKILKEIYNHFKIKIYIYKDHPAHCRKIEDTKTHYIYGFIASAEKSILDNQEFQSKLHLYSQDFLSTFINKKGGIVLGFGIDDRVVGERLKVYMLKDWWYTLVGCNNNPDFLIYNYIWFDCPPDLIDFFKDKYYMKSLEYNPNLLYRIV